MTNTSMTPGSRPRRGVAAVLGLLAGGGLLTAAVLAGVEAADPPGPAGAADLAAFASCDDLAAWGQEAMGLDDGAVTMEGAPSTTMASSATMAESAAGAPEPATREAEGSFDAVGGEVADGSAGAADATGGAGDEAVEAEAGGPVEDGTNVAVEGVDEVDLVDRLAPDVVLVASARTLAIVDLADGEVRARMTVPGDAQITYDAEAGVAWVVGHDDTAGGVSVERVAVADEALTSEGRWATSGSLVDARRVGGELHVVATEGFPYPDDVLPAPLPTDGDVPTSAAATEPASVPFADGPVPCDEVLHTTTGAETDRTDPTATLLVTLPATGEVEPVRSAEVVGSGQLVHVTTEAAYLATPSWGPDGATTGIHRFDLDTLQATGSGAVAGSMLDQFSMSEHDGVLRVAVTDEGGAFVRTPVPIEDGPGVAVEGDVAVDDGVRAEEVAPPPEGPTTTFGPGPTVTGPAPEEPVAEGLNEVVVLDTEGSLDEVGRTERFGHPGETLHGVRFVGDVGYAVTFLQTDPFYVLDLADPTSPQVVGEVELPGFSSYLHPIGDGLVVGFGPGGDGRAAAKLFDVSDPTTPTVVDDLALGDDSPVAGDHHAFVDLGEGRFAVPATTWDPRSGATTSAAVVVDTAGGTLAEEERLEAATASPATRALPAAEGWALLAEDEIVLLDAAGAERGRVELA